MQPLTTPPLRAGRPLRRSLWVAAAAGLLLLAACGGGGDGAGPAAPAGNESAATAWTQGTITGFGSVIVNGVRFDDSACTVTDDNGRPLSSSALRLGMQVEIDSGRIDDSTGTARAHALRVGSQLTGPVQAVDAAAGTLTVLGQGVDVGAGTVFDDSLAGGLAAVAAGAVVEVHGVLNAATGRIAATRIEAETSPAVYKLRGTVASLDTAARTLRIGAVLVSYAGVAAVPANLANGATLRVSLATTPVAGVWQAQALGTRPARPADRAQARLRGAVTAFSSASSFSVDGTPVDASAASFPDGSAGLALGASVEVKGALVNGTLVATQVALEDRHQGDDDRHFELHGLVTAVDAAAQTFVLRGVTVSHAGSVAYAGGSAANLLVGARVEVRGTPGSDRSTLAAVRIRFES